MAKGLHSCDKAKTLRQGRDTGPDVIMAASDAEGEIVGTRLGRCASIIEDGGSQKSESLEGPSPQRPWFEPRETHYELLLLRVVR